MKEYPLIESEPSPFLFDVWKCPICSYVLTVEQYYAMPRDYRCSCCYLATVREFIHWPGEVSNN